MRHLILLLITVASAPAALVTGNIKDTALNPAATNLTFTPLSTPMADAPTIIFSAVQTVQTDAQGQFAVTLAPGDYKVTIGGNAADAFLISVPPGPATNAWTDLATGALIYRYPYSPAYVDRIIAVAKGDLYVFDGAQVVRLPAGAGGEFLSADASAAAGLRWRLPPQAWRQAVMAELITPTNTNAIIPVDDTPPLASEGLQVVSATLTPRTAAGFIQAQFSGMVYVGANVAVTAALFRSGEPAALAAVTDTLTVGQLRQVTLAARVPAQSTNAQTFSVRIGPASATTIYLNGNASGRLLGGAAAQRLILTETD
ncbi:MAG: hypothetical protein N3J91_09685 [Verrucomicrobiae bacterium]|nr:hypothetical protein [Verrucomicrobiae bacterium]